MNRAFSGGEYNLTRFSDWGAWSVYFGHTLRSTFGGYLVEELVVPVMGAVADHCDGYTFGR
jgi:hypothetical protein